MSSIVASLSSVTDTTKAKVCPFCRIIRGEAPGEIVFAEEDAVALLDYRPMADGHVLVVPRGHFKDVEDVPYDVAAELSAMVRRVVSAQRQVLGASGALILNNNVIDQHVAHHHIHVVPRKVADGISLSVRKTTTSKSVAELQKLAELLRG